VELDASPELNATECSKLAGAELAGGTDLGSGRGRRMEHDRDGRRESRRLAAWAAPASGAGRVRPTSEGGMGERSPSRDGGQCRWGQRPRAAQEESVRVGAARASGVVPRAGARSAEWGCDAG
jgi:hypothetical protein